MLLRIFSFFILFTFVSFHALSPAHAFRWGTEGKVVENPGKDKPDRGDHGGQTNTSASASNSGGNDRDSGSSHDRGGSGGSGSSGSSGGSGSSDSGGGGCCSGE